MTTAKDVVDLLGFLDDLGLDDKVKAINEIRSAIHEKSPFKTEPVDCVQWVKQESVEANAWNPNSVAKPEMELLRLSIESDGYTQPIVAFREGDNENVEVVDGFHRHVVGSTSKSVSKRIHGYLPIAVINSDRGEKNDRMAATIRHNRARGKHSVSKMGDIVLELAKRNWSDKRIAKELGLDMDECLRLKQITGIAEMFSSDGFSEAWEVDMNEPE